MGVDAAAEARATLLRERFDNDKRFKAVRPSAESKVASTVSAYRVTYV
jgi:hypothetical protein